MQEDTDHLQAGKSSLTKSEPQSHLDLGSASGAVSSASAFLWLPRHSAGQRRGLLL